jgi:hypothetical protein
MTPKEKSKELFNKYAMYLRANLMYSEDANEDAKQCALIAVDEILEVCKTYLSSYYLEVKKEIEKL